MYVYLAYGMHFCMNVVTGSEHEGSAVLLRAAEPLEGIADMRTFRGRDSLHELCSGPGKLCQAFAVDRSHDGVDLVRGANLWLAEGEPVPGREIDVGSRVGIRTGVDRPWRFRVRGDPWVSAGRPASALSRSGR